MNRNAKVQRMQSQRRSIGRTALVAALLAPLSALAAPTADCNIDTSAAGVAFGAYDPFAIADMAAVGRISVTCDKNNVPMTIALSSGGAGGFFPRRMTSGADTLDYNLYTSPGGSVIFGDGTPGTQSVPASTGAVGGGSFAATVWIHGRLPAGQNAAVGSYSDTVFITVYY